MISSKQQKLILDIVSEYKPKTIGIFGSYARGENDQNSDLDILIDFESPVDLLEIIGLEQDLSEKLGIKVDLITVRSLNPQLKEYVEKDLIPLVQ
ncbi:nucleotidyltransferase family protein [Catalinimonas niigatensis]|uniref:nucleotidyltransferase family protein n=1 Tax=Catalinimonas niigatensis TaxID=1397264 RepID=UPI002665BE94|nr:nucleotidyltransferase family protein [Catalinimonas niigatensis]WPP49692.1 nucleotidyltransferase family protein [Catalinimonas niigatensis]